MKASGTDGPNKIRWELGRKMILISFIKKSTYICNTFAKTNVWRWSWWRHQMETFSALLAICAGNSPVPGEFPTQRPVTRSFDVYFDLRPNKRLSKQPWGWWFETLSCSLWRHRNGDSASDIQKLDSRIHAILNKYVAFPNSRRKIAGYTIAWFWSILYILWTTTYSDG